ncbi:MAG: NADH-quinone oxidoreductase subunit NuoF [bacterium]|nr:NADH-quinone oxidoreductase subunit NuoF [bacterium]
MKITVGLSSCGIASGALDILEAIKAKFPSIEAKQTGCIGFCYLEPLMEVDGNMYGSLTPDKAIKIINSYLNNLPIDTPQIDKESLLSGQYRIVLRNCGIIDPESIEEYIGRGGYQALTKAREMSPDEIISEVTKSGLRGRGGAGFPTGIKWGLAKKGEAPKYIICNADEGDPGAFMDRSILESDPHSVLEGMAIGGIAIGADTGIIYVRAEYPLAIKRLKIAISQAEKKGLLRGFKIVIKEGAGAFVCGEETALIASIEGKRGMPRIRPPFPAVSGLFGRPTNINNVETWANIPWIIQEGGEAFTKIGTEGSKGTKVFCLAGKVKKTGLVEVPMGISLRDVVFRLGGGIKDDKRFKAIQIGGPSGGCIPEELLETKVDYDSLTKVGAIMGSGGMVIVDETTCMVDVARFFLDFTQNESCGKCTFCRIGTKRMLETLTRITEGKGELKDIDLLIELAEKIKTTSLCGLGQTAPNPVLTTLRYFRDEYEAHIKEKRCPSLTCRNLLIYSIDHLLCTGCMLCAKKCPVSAIFGEKKMPHSIDQSKCTRCGLCANLCKEKAIKIG